VKGRSRSKKSCDDCVKHSISIFVLMKQLAKCNYDSLKREIYNSSWLSERRKMNIQ